jgi:heme exporter protein B
MNAFFMIVQRDLLLVMRRKSEVLTALFFFVIVTSLFPLGIGADTALLRKIAPGVIWVSALLATLLGLQRLFGSDYQDGTLEQLALSPRSFVVLVLGKITAHWLVCGLPLLILAPVIGLQFDLDTASLKTLLLTLLLGTPVLSLIGSIGAALTLGLRGGVSCWCSKSCNG